MYDIYPIKMVEQVVTSTTSTTTDSISQNSKNVNTNSYSISTPVFTPEKAADEVVKRAENSADVTERLPIKAHNKLREVEKKLCRDIANHYGVYGYRVNELQEGVRRLTSEYLESGSVSLETIKEFADFMKERFGKEDSFTGEDGITYPLSNGVKFAIREAINSDLKYIKAEYQRISDEVNGKREESASEDMATARNERTRRFVSKKVRELRNTLTEDFGVAEKDKKGLEERIYALVAKISLGTFTEADVSSFYGDVFDSVSILDDTMKQNYPLVYSYLKTTKLTLSESNKKDLAGYGSYKEFREDAPSFLKIGKEGTSVADMYSELNDLAPDLFPKDVINENDEAVKILEVAKRFVSSRVGLRETMSPEERKSLYDRTERAVKGLERDVRTAIRYSQGTATVTEQAYVEDNDVDVAEVTEKLEALKRERSKMLLARGKTILSDKDERALRAIIDGTQTIEGLDDSYNKKDIEMVYEASREYEKLKAEAEEYKRALRQRRYDRAKKYLEDGDVLTGFRDHSSAFLYMINPLERNLEYIGKRGEISQRLIDAYVKPIKRANRDGILYKNSIIAKIKALNLSRKSEGGNTHSESFAVQFVGEAESCIETLKRMNNPRATESGKSLAEWQAELEEFWKVNADMDKGKIYGAVEVFRGIYDELFRRMNEARVKSGYEPVSYRKGYFPHFNPRENNDFIALFGKSLGFNMEFDGLPATINGLTHTFKPGIKYFGAAEARQGYETVF
ncbi:MAG: hypothetical protein IIV81_01715, partial [Clostridia bacterium]|nr:hypothetical protein [Clostridia bacterium]